MERRVPIAGCTTTTAAFRFARAVKRRRDAACRWKSARSFPRADDRAHVYCAGLNYRDHAEEVRMPIPASPVFFTKAGALAGAHDDIVYPEGVTLLDYEVELALVVGAPVTRHSVVTADNLPSYILGIAIMNDVSARDVQLVAGQWFLGRASALSRRWDRRADPRRAGPLARLDALELELSAYNALGAPYDYKRQRGTTADMIFRPHELIRRLGEQFDLLPGDIIATGTPRGVAWAGRRASARARARNWACPRESASRASSRASAAQSEVPGTRRPRRGAHKKRATGWSIWGCRGTISCNATQPHPRPRLRQERRTSGQISFIVNFLNQMKRVYTAGILHKPLSRGRGVAEPG